jgi:hypothetical protein
LEHEKRKWGGKFTGNEERRIAKEENKYMNLGFLDFKDS